MYCSTWTNTEGQTERVFFIIDSFSSSGHGDFQLTWTTSTPSPPAPPGSCSVAPVAGSRCGSLVPGSRVRATGSAHDRADSIPTGTLGSFMQAASSGAPPCQVRWDSGPHSTYYVSNPDRMHAHARHCLENSCSPTASSHRHQRIETSSCYPAQVYLEGLECE